MGNDLANQYLKKDETNLKREGVYGSLLVEEREGGRREGRGGEGKAHNVLLRKAKPSQRRLHENDKEKAAR